MESVPAGPLRYHADHVRRAKVDGRYKVCVCHILYLLVQTI